MLLLLLMMMMNILTSAISASCSFYSYIPHFPSHLPSPSFFISLYLMIFCRSIVMEESAQMLEIESLIPMLLQPDSSNLKRITLIGEHHQLPPVVSNETIKGYSNFDQSMFTRLIRLGASLLFLLLVLVLLDFLHERLRLFLF